MRIALCLFGIIGGTKGRNGEGDYIDPRIGFEAYDEHLFTNYDVDVFIHTWSTDWQDELVSLYRPKRIIAEKQELFENLQLADYGIDSFEQLIASKGHELVYQARKQSGFSDTEVEEDFQKLAFRSSSRWLSTMKSINLMADYETEVAIEYDYVVSGRFDIKLQKDIRVEGLNKKTLYAAYRHNRVDYEHAFYDLIFMGGSNVMKRFGCLYNHRYKYSIRPTWACREHCEKMQIDYADFFDNDTDYSLVRLLK